MSARGFTLVELLVAALLVAAVTGAVAGMAIPARHAFERTLAGADLSTGSRAALERLTADLREAGSGPDVGAGHVSLGDAAAVLVPLASLDDPRVASPGRAVRVLRVARAAPQGLLVDPVPAGAATMRLETSARCTQIGPACGLTPGALVLLLDAARAVVLTVASTGAGGSVRVSTSVPFAFEPGAVMAAVTSTVYGTRLNSDGSHRLVRAFAGGAEQPVLQNVVDFEVSVMGQPEPPTPYEDETVSMTYGPVPPGAGIDDPRDAWAAGENCVVVRDLEDRPQPRLPPIGTALAPVALTTAMLTDGPWCADPLDPARFDADLLRVRAVEVRLRVESASADWRGPPGRLFRRPGTAINPSRWVPDMETRLRIEVRNAGR